MQYLPTRLPWKLCKEGVGRLKIQRVPHYVKNPCKSIIFWRDLFVEKNVDAKEAPWHHHQPLGCCWIQPRWGRLPGGKGLQVPNAILLGYINNKLDKLEDPVKFPDGCVQLLFILALYIKWKGETNGNYENLNADAEFFRHLALRRWRQLQHVNKLLIIKLQTCPSRMIFW